MVEITSWTPFFTFKYPAIAAQSAEVRTATNMIKEMCTIDGRATAAPRAADSNAPIKYCDSTPILNKPILNPTATATAEM